MLQNVVFLLIMLAGLVMIPFGLPGLWLMIGVVAYGVFIGDVAWWTLAFLVVFGVVAEVLEFFAVKMFSDRYGGSKKAFWAAIAGGIIGAFVGTPVPLVGNVIGALIAFRIIYFLVPLVTAITLLVVSEVVRWRKR